MYYYIQYFIQRYLDTCQHLKIAPDAPLIYFPVSSEDAPFEQL